MLDLDPSRLADLAEMPGGKAFVAHLSGMFLTDARRLVGALEGALAAQDATALSRHAHTLKGTAQGVGAVALAALCAQLEHEPDPDQRIALVARLPQRLRATEDALRDAGFTA